MGDLNTERIAAAALKVAHEGGVAGFTMKAVADALGVTPMALYHHVKDKAALAGLLVDAGLREQPLPLPSGSWEDDLWEMARWMRTSSQAFPTVGRIQRMYGIWSPAILAVTEHWLAIWLRSGLTTEHAVTAARVSSLALAGYVEEESVLQDMTKPEEGTLALLPNARVIFKDDRDRDAEFELAVRSLVCGLHLRLGRK
jgi:AcrR family transcriptional regulator